jgi:internalin A
LTQLKYACIWKLNNPDLSFVAKMSRLTEIRLIQMRHPRIEGLDQSAALSILDLSHNSKLASIGRMPKSLTKLKVRKCGELRDLAFLAHHQNLEFLYFDVMENLAFVPDLPMLAYIGFENVLDGDLSPLLKSASLTKVGFHPPKRKHYSHSLPDLTRLLDANRRQKRHAGPTISSDCLSATAAPPRLNRRPNGYESR